MFPYGDVPPFHLTPVSPTPVFYHGHGRDLMYMQIILYYILSVFHNLTARRVGGDDPR
jgi:hypothetical protein